MAVTKLNPPLIDGIVIAQAGTTLHIPFQMNRSVARGDVSAILAEIKSVQTNTSVATLTSTGTNDNFMYYKNNQWWVDFTITSDTLLIGQYYKIQLAYKSKAGAEGFWSTVATFKYTKATTPTILTLQGSGVINTNIYEYTGQYTNEDDPSEKVYSYWFNIYELGKDTPIITSGELLHNSSTDTSSTFSTDTWTTRWVSDGDYTIEYNVRTINGLELSSTKYRITDNQTVDSDILRYYDFVARNNADGGYVELAIEPNNAEGSSDRKYINGQFILLRASSEDNFQSWYQLTEFILANWDSSTRRYLCRDYCVSQGVTYIYALQAFNAQNIYSKRIEAEPLFVDFEDMYLSDGERQLRVRFNPKVTSFKNTILESKMDTIGGKYPFFFRNGNVKYKEFPISGLISTLTDENGDFMSGLQIVEPLRVLSEADAATSFADPLTSLSAENFRREREFKTEVLEWLTNGKPKLFRSPGEGSFLVRLMNTSLSPNDTLSRMLHTFSCTAYEIADCTFENLREYGMLMEEKLETRDLAFSQFNLANHTDGKWSGSAVMATITGQPNTRFYYRCQNDKTNKSADLGVTGVYEFDRHLLAENPLVYLQSYNKTGSGWQNATLTYGYYVDFVATDFSIIDKVEIVDRVERWIGSNADEIIAHLDEKQIRHSIGTIYYLNVMTRPHHTVTSATLIEGNKYKFMDGSKVYNPTDEVIVKVVNGNTTRYFDGRTSTLIEKLDYNFDMTKNGEPGSDMSGQYFSTHTNGKIVLTDLQNITNLYLGNALYADIVYQFATRYFTVEKDPNSQLALLRKAWEDDPTNQNKYNKYYTALVNALGDQKVQVTVNAI